MRILQVITLSELGGAQSVVINLANKLSENHEVTVIAGEGDGKMWQMLYPNVRQEPCKHLGRALSLVDDFLTIIDFQKLYRKYKPDIVHLHSSKAGMLGRIAFPSKKIIYTVHGFDSIRLAYRKFLPIEQLIQYMCKAIVGVSHYDVKNLKAEKITHNVHCVYNGICPVETDRELSFRLPENYDKIVLCIARLSPQKNSNLFMSVAELLPNYAFVWIGNQREVEEHPDNVYFLGNISNAGMYNSIADLFILPSNYEGLPMVILEAMSCGKPIVASNVGGISEIVKNGENGYVVDNIPQAFAEKISYILGNEDVCHSFSICSRNRFIQDLTVDKMVDAYLGIYNL
ncbi:glycosyltransferase [Phocaeicola sp.]